MSTKKRKRKVAAKPPQSIAIERKLLVWCLPEAWAGAWLAEFDNQNADLLDSGEAPLKHHEFIKCRLEDLATGGRGECPW